MIRIHRVLIGACAAALIVVTAPLAVNAANNGTAADPAGADANAFAQGARAWADACSHCHNFRDPMEFSDGQWRAVMSHMRIRANLTGQQARDIQVFLQGSNNPATPYVVTAALTTATAAGRSAGEPAVLFNQTCVACHGANGKGVLPGVPDFTASNGPLAQKTDAELVVSVLNGLQTPGATMAMPAKGGNVAITEADAAGLVRYLRQSFAGQKQP